MDFSKQCNKNGKEKNLNKPKYKFFMTNEIKPTGWLKKQLEIQANGLSGNLDKV